MPMDIGLSAPVDVNNCHGLYMHTLESTNGGSEDLSVNELGNGVTEILSIQDDRDGIRGSKPPNGKCEFQKKDEATNKCFRNCTTFPCSSKTTSSAAALVGATLEGEMKDGADAITSKESTLDDNFKSVDPPCPHSLSLPTALKLVSAMKGSREKRGATPPTKLTVKWAPDVYDPIPTSVSHTITNSRPHRQSKKNKNKQKNGNKSSRGSKHKDKKQGRKRGGNSSNTGFKWPEHEEEEVVDFCKPPPTAMDFHVGNPDQFCGSSFLKRYGRSLHLSSVAEAT